MGTQDPKLISESGEFKISLDKEWKRLRTALMQYTVEGDKKQIFDLATVQREVFTRLYAQVCTRCFGWGIPCLSMVPMCDNYNHSDVTVV